MCLLALGPNTTYFCGLASPYLSNYKMQHLHTKVILASHIFRKHSAVTFEFNLMSTEVLTRLTLTDLSMMDVDFHPKGLARPQQ